jgi:caspase domain-containing protein
MSERRDIELASGPEGTIGRSGRSVIAAIGIDRYQGWRRLRNAVSDARGALALFERLGFEQVTRPLLDGAATGKVIQELVMDDLRTLGPEDSLVLFYAGHGGTRTDRLGSQEVKTGYLIPVDASDRAATWIELDSWLRAVARLPAKHILVILDACHSGIALGPIIKWRDTGTWQDTPLSTLKARRSRRIITSALDDQVALDSGPVYGHSLFTGCLIEGLTHGLGGGSRRVTTGSELGLYVQRRVETYPHSRQTPDFGTFDFDDRGELVIPLVREQPEEPVAPVGPRPPSDPVPKARPPIASPAEPALPIAPAPSGAGSRAERPVAGPAPGAGPASNAAPSPPELAAAPAASQVLPDPAGIARDAGWPSWASARAQPPRTPTSAATGDAGWASWAPAQRWRSRWPWSRTTRSGRSPRLIPSTRGCNPPGPVRRAARTGWCACQGGRSRWEARTGRAMPTNIRNTR